MGALILSSYKGWAEYLGCSKLDYIWGMGIVCGYDLGSLLLWAILLIISKSNYWYVCSVLKFTLIHTTNIIKPDGQGTE